VLFLCLVVTWGQPQTPEKRTPGLLVGRSWAGAWRFKIVYNPHGEIFQPRGEVMSLLTLARA
jgi:hypothetical protein